MKSKKTVHISWKSKEYFSWNGFFVQTLVWVRLFKQQLQGTILLYSFNGRLGLPGISTSPWWVSTNPWLPKSITAPTGWQSLPRPLSACCKECNMRCFQWQAHTHLLAWKDFQLPVAVITKSSFLKPVAVNKAKESANVEGATRTLLSNMPLVKARSVVSARQEALALDQSFELKVVATAKVQDLQGKTIGHMPHLLC